MGNECKSLNLFNQINLGHFLRKESKSSFFLIRSKTKLLITNTYNYGLRITKNISHDKEQIILFGYSMSSSFYRKFLNLINICFKFILHITFQGEFYQKTDLFSVIMTFWLKCPHSLINWVNRYDFYGISKSSIICRCIFHETSMKYEG